jgi:hypothetical protein
MDQPVRGGGQRRIRDLRHGPPLVFAQLRRRRAVKDQQAAVILEHRARLGTRQPRPKTPHRQRPDRKLIEF